MPLLSKNYICLSIGIICFVTQVLSRPQSQIGEKADQIFNTTRQTVTDAVGIAQGALGLALGAASTAVIGQINMVQNVAKLGVNVGRAVIEFGEQTILDAIPNLNTTLGIKKK